jgi:hypothetical protein
VAKFEVGVYNKQVADAVAVGEHHRHFADSWAETHYIDVEAEDATAARRKIEVLHSEKNGFVILSVEPKRDDAI